jgi:hypothetical protein
LDPRAVDGVPKVAEVDHPDQHTSDRDDLAPPPNPISSQFLSALYTKIRGK